jgi:hypothetical protein
MKESVKEKARIAARMRNVNKNALLYKPDSERWPEMSLRKVPADSVPFGESISRNGRTVWAAYHNGELVALGVTRDEARAKYRAWVVKAGMEAHKNDLDRNAERRR